MTGGVRPGVRCGVAIDPAGADTFDPHSVDVLALPGVDAIAAARADAPDPLAGYSDCVACGACCATYRVAFYWAEADALGLPDTHVERLDPWRACMAGSNAKAPRCVALIGQVGIDAHCSIYAQRPSPCHDLQRGDAQCLRARARHGLPVPAQNVAAAPEHIAHGDSDTHRERRLRQPGAD